ncbi:hypothetical protein BU15DRAFT_78336 [Melanogaster broomeanus]|nr:hypothetical protein BU15DRAFT_78336 [Melanogaster broomeanus]
MDLATQGDATNPMAPAAIRTATSKPWQNRRVKDIRSQLEASQNEGDSSGQQAPLTPNIQPEFSVARQGSQFGFHLPNVSMVGTQVSSVVASHATSAVSVAPVSRPVSAAKSSCCISTVPSSRSASAAPSSRSVASLQPSIATAPTSQTSCLDSRSHLQSVSPSSSTLQTKQLQFRNDAMSPQSLPSFPPNKWSAPAHQGPPSSRHTISCPSIPTRPMLQSQAPSHVSLLHNDTGIMDPQPPIGSNFSCFDTDEESSPDPHPAGSRRLTRTKSYWDVRDQGNEDCFDGQDQQSQRLQDNGELEIDEASPSEDEHLAESVLHGDSQYNGYQVEDIVAEHHRRNRGPRLPSSAELNAIRQEETLYSGRVTPASQSPSPEGNPEEGTRAGPPPLPPPPSMRSSRRPGRGHSRHGDDPSQLQYYPPVVRDILERAKAISHCDAASLNPYPSRAWYDTKGCEYVEEAISERARKTLPIPTGWWPDNAKSIMKLLWEDLTNRRSAIKKRARTFVTERYEWDSDKRPSVNSEIALQLLENGGAFHRDGVDEHGRTNNLAHPALKGLVLDFFYTGPNSVGAMFPEVFRHEVPRPAIALAVTALKAALDDIAYGESGFKAQKYQDHYISVPECMSKCDTDPIHKVKTRALRVEWALIGSNANTATPSAAHNKFDVLLD